MTTDDQFVRMVQNMLLARGLYSGKIDGDAGVGTLAAWNRLMTDLEKALPAPISILPRVEEDLIPDAGDAKLETVRLPLQKLIKRASVLSQAPFTVIEGIRSVSRQKELVARGASKTMNSFHLTGDAVDLWPLGEDGKTLSSGSPEKEAILWRQLRLIAGAVKDAARELNIPVTWGGDWKSFPDAPHFQIPRDFQL